MKLPAPLAALVEAGVVDAALRPLSRGMTPSVLLVRSDGAVCVAKLEATPGGAAREAAVLGRLVEAGVRVPAPRGASGGVLRMELVRTLEGAPAPRLSDVTLPPDEAKAVFEAVVREVARMLAADVIHRELSPRDVLLSPHGPTLVDLRDAVEASSGPDARVRLIRGVNAVRDRCARAAPALRDTCYGEELWSLYARGALTPEARLTGRWRQDANDTARPRARASAAATDARPWAAPPSPGRHPRPWLQAGHAPRETPVKPAPTPRETPVKPAPTPRETPVKPAPTPRETPTSPAPRETPVRPAPTPRETPVKTAPTPRETPASPAPSRPPRRQP